MFQNKSITPLIAFRIIFGALMLFGTVRFVCYGWVEQLYIKPQFFFGYYGFEWVKPLTNNWMYLPFVLMIVCSICIIAGWKYRLASILFFLNFTYVELLDKTNYLNHYYFVSIIAFLMCFLPAHRDFSIDVNHNPSKYSSTVPAWIIGILKLQLGLVYFFAGIAKINSDWLLEAQPLKIWLQAFRDVPLVGDIFAQEPTAYLFSWFGCIYDLSIPFLLLINRTRKWAYVAVVVFHILTWILFPIGVFPWVMIFCTLIFFPTDFHEKWIDKLKKGVRWTKNEIISNRQVVAKKWIMPLLLVFFALQICIPLRHVLYSGRLFWNEEGYRFSWRVMLMEKKGSATFYIEDPTTRNTIEINNLDYLTKNQEDQMATQPDMILQFAHHLGTVFNDTVLVYGNQHVHLQHPKVHAEVWATLNGKPHQLLVDKKHDLLQFPYNLAHRTWVEKY